MSTFGRTLQHLRSRTRNPHTGKKLTQGQFAQELERLSGFQYGYGTISGWERGDTDIHRHDRALLLGILRVLVVFGGVVSADEANGLLQNGSYAPLSDEEIQHLAPEWSAHSGETTLLPPETLLIGRETVLEELRALFAARAHPLIFLSGRGGIGKSAVANAVARMLKAEGAVETIVWLPFEREMVTSAETLTLKLGEQLLPNSIDRTSARRRADQVRGVLKSQRSLIVIDGVESAEHSDTSATSCNRISIRHNGSSQAASSRQNSTRLPSTC